jgi:hypothetical protein
MVPGCYANSPQEAIDRATPLLESGAVRIHGGGFAGGILAVTLKENTDKLELETKVLDSKGEREIKSLS